MKVDEILEPEEFDAIFRGKVFPSCPSAFAIRTLNSSKFLVQGILIQPTPTNKPNSSVTIITYVGDDAIKAVFGDELKPLKGDVWSIGGAFRQCSMLAIS